MIFSLTPELIRDRMLTYFPDQHARLIAGMTFGTDIDRTSFLYEKLRVVGLLHIVVLSGSNISMLVEMISSLTKRLHISVQIMISMAGVMVFLMFVRPEPPIIRAGIMAMIQLYAILTGRQTKAWYSLFLAVVIIVIWKFEWLTSVSFQLSVSATAGIILSSKLTRKRVEKFKNPLVRFFLDEAIITIFAFMSTTPISYYYFGTISPLGPIANILVGFIVPFIMMVGLYTASVGMIFPQLMPVATILGYGATSYLFVVVDMIYKLSIKL